MRRFASIFSLHASALPAVGNAANGSIAGEVLARLAARHRRFSEGQVDASVDRRTQSPGGRVETLY